MIVTEGASYHERVMGKPIPCRRYGQEPITAAAIADPRRFADHQGLDARTLFRRPTRGCPGWQPARSNGHRTDAMRTELNLG
jgi:hypothetical protein